MDYIKKYCGFFLYWLNKPHNTISGKMILLVKVPLENFENHRARVYVIVPSSQTFVLQAPKM